MKTLKYGLSAAIFHVCRYSFMKMNLSNPDFFLLPLVLSISSYKETDLKITHTSFPVTLICSFSNLPQPPVMIKTNPMAALPDSATSSPLLVDRGLPFFYYPHVLVWHGVVWCAVLLWYSECSLNLNTVIFGKEIF